MKKTCPICEATALALDCIDLNKNCEEENGFYLPLSGTAVYFYLCRHCKFCFCPEMHEWSEAKFKKEIYGNDIYKLIDPDYFNGTRSEANSKNILKIVEKTDKTNFKHLDFGGGDGQLSRLLVRKGINSSSYDLYGKNKELPTSKFNLITAFEVFEHSPDPVGMMKKLESLFSKNALLYFSTLVNDEYIHENKRITWNYASPRNGHISLFSKASLSLLANKFGLNYASINKNFHYIWKDLPDWAEHLIKGK